MRALRNLFFRRRACELEDHTQYCEAYAQQHTDLRARRIPRKDGVKLRHRRDVVGEDEIKCPSVHGQSGTTGIRRGDDDKDAAKFDSQDRCV